MSVLHLDFETFAHRDLKKVGVFEYVKCPHLEVSVIAWAFDDQPVKSVVWPYTRTLPEGVRAHLLMGGEAHAWNTAFERAIIEDHYGLVTTPAQWVCTMQRALVYGLPASLGAAGPALGLSIVKDVTAEALMKRMSKPKKDGTAYHRTDPVKLTSLEAYCRRDVEAEREIGRHIPGLTSFETEVSRIDALSNARGVTVDEAAVKTLIAAQAWVKSKIHTEAALLTGGKVIKVESDVQKLVEWINTQGISMASVDKEAVSAALLDPNLPPKVRRVLELRRAASKGSLGKLDKMLLMRGADGRARGILQYYGAGRTGRWAGRGIQVQNLPRNRSGLDPDEVLGTIRAKVEGLELFYEKPLDALSECLRACLTASLGKLLAMVDLSQIEARVVAWLAGQTDILRVFREGKEDVYVWAARKIGSSDRQLGKVVTLACGFQMGGPRFQATAYDYGITMSEDEASRTVTEWRKANPQIVAYWYALDRAARAAIATPGSIHVAGNVRLRVRDGKLLIQKPNKAVLIYHRPRISDGNIVFDGVINSKYWGTRKLYGGLMTENITQSVARDLIAEALVRIENRTGRVPVMTIHDEVVYEVDSGEVGKAIQHEVNLLPAWAAGLPVASKLHVAFRFGK